MRNAQYEQPVMWRSLEQTPGKIGPLRAYATYNRSYIYFDRARAVEDGRGLDRAVLGEGERAFAATSPT
jgi:hypothetical protein